MDGELIGAVIAILLLAFIFTLPFTTPFLVLWWGFGVSFIKSAVLSIFVGTVIIFWAL